MSVAVDTNVIITLIAGADDDARAAERALSQASHRGSLFICPIVYSELYAHPGWGHAEIEDFLTRAQIDVRWSIGRQAWHLAGEAFAAYAQRRRRAGGGQPRRLLADFVIGAHAAVENAALLTSDAGFYRRAFSELRIIVPA